MNQQIVRQRIKEIRQEVEEMERLAQCGPAEPETTSTLEQHKAIDQNRFSILSCVNNIGDACRSIRAQLKA